ncbi:hypothetical protein JKF63_05058 [Porcisia hertigi]|uniref:Temperature dependent protein affecting M2 dsRNA replication n=1 Tax=Porcisia hertigi TaxID=2761500 RepID=A0A836IWK2_9TRYP|nr:hypothetical protein JKF63_05058 [Porcisia hertigi]
MPPRMHRSGGGQGSAPQQQQAPPSHHQHQQQAPPQQHQQGYGNGPGGPQSHLHVFHHHTGYGDNGRGGMPPPPQHGGSSGSNNMNSMMYSGGGVSGNAPTSPIYGGGGGGGPYGSNNGSIPSHMMSPSPHPQMVGMGNEYTPHMQSSPFPQPPPQQGGSTSTPNSITRRVRTPGPSNMGPPPQQQQQQQLPPPPQQQSYYGGNQGGGMGYNPNMRSSAPPPPQPHMEPSPSFVNSRPQQPQPGIMRGDGGYGLDVDSSPPPQNNGYRGSQPPPPPPPMQQQQQQMHMHSPSTAPPQQHYQGNGGYGGGRGMGGGMQNPSMQMQPHPPPPPPPPQHMMGGGGSAPNNSNRGMLGLMGGSKHMQQGPPPPPHQHQQQMPPLQQQHQPGMNSNWGSQQPPPTHMQSNVSPSPQGQPPMGGMPYSGGGPVPMVGRTRVPGARMGGSVTGPMGNNMGAPQPPLPQKQHPHPHPQQQQQHQQQQHQRQQPQSPSVMGGIGGSQQMPAVGNASPSMMMMPPPLQGGQPPMMRQSGGVPPGMYAGGMDSNAISGDLVMGGMSSQSMPGYTDDEQRGDLTTQQPLYEFLMEKRLLRKTTLSTFFPEGYDAKRDGRITIAVDGNYMITNLRAQLQRVDPLWFLHSCLPDYLLTLVHKHVEQMRSHNLEPLWVLNGISINGDVEAFLPSEGELESRDVVWAKLNEGVELPTQDEITEAFETSSAVGEDVVRAIQRFLRTENVVCVTAPFLNWCQMCTLHKEGLAQLLMGPPEMLMVPYDGMKVIAEVNLQTSEVAYYDRDEVLRELFPSYVTEVSTAAAGDRFLDFGLLIASHPAITTAHASVQLSTQSIYEELSTPHPNFSTLREFIDQYEYPQNQNQHPNLEKLKHAKGRTYIQYSPVFSSQASFDSSLVYFKRILDPSLTNANMPTNLSGVFGYLVPLSLFYFQFTGFLSVGLMTAVTQLYIRDEFPVADTEEYHHLLHPLMALRGQIISQMVSRIKSDAHGQRLGKISWVRWFESILMSVLPPDRLIVLDEWNLEGSQELASVPDDHLQKIDMSMVLSLKSSAMCIPAPQLPPNSSPRDAPILYHGKKETFFAILLKTFDFVGYFSHTADPMDAAEVMSEPVQATVQGQPACDDQHNNSDSVSVDLADSTADPSMGEQRVFFTAYLSVSLEHCPQEFQCALVRFTELVRVSTINSIAFTYADRGDSPSSEDGALADPPEVLLATRIACLVSVPYPQQVDEKSPFEWAPVYSRQLCAFTVMSRVMNRSLRVLTEAIAAALFLSGFSDCSLEDYNSMTPLLPFGDVPSSLGGLLLHYVLVFPPDYEANCQTPEERCHLLETKFKAIPDIQTQLRRVMEFTFHALYLLNVYILRDPSIVSSVELVETDVVANALNLLHEKWVLHLDGPAPVDVHGYFVFQ